MVKKFRKRYAIAYAIAAEKEFLAFLDDVDQDFVKEWFFRWFGSPSLVKKERVRVG